MQANVPGQLLLWVVSRIPGTPGKWCHCIVFACFLSPALKFNLNLILRRGILSKTVSPLLLSCVCMGGADCVTLLSFQLSALFFSPLRAHWWLTESLNTQQCFTLPWVKGLKVHVVCSLPTSLELITDPGWKEAALPGWKFCCGERTVLLPNLQILPWLLHQGPTRLRKLTALWLEGLRQHSLEWQPCKGRGFSFTYLFKATSCA